MRRKLSDSSKGERIYNVDYLRINFFLAQFNQAFMLQ